MSLDSELSKLESSKKDLKARILLEPTKFHYEETGYHNCSDANSNTYCDSPNGRVSRSRIVIDEKARYGGPDLKKREETAEEIRRIYKETEHRIIRDLTGKILTKKLREKRPYSSINILLFNLKKLFTT